MVWIMAIVSQIVILCSRSLDLMASDVDDEAQAVAVSIYVFGLDLPC